LYKHGLEELIIEHAYVLFGSFVVKDF